MRVPLRFVAHFPVSDSDLECKMRDSRRHRARPPGGPVPVRKAGVAH
jgi:hypothetical protein